MSKQEQLHGTCMGPNIIGLNKVKVLSKNASLTASKLEACMGKLLKVNGQAGVGSKYGVFYSDGFCDLYTNNLDEARLSYEYLQMPGCVLEYNAQGFEEKKVKVGNADRSELTLLAQAGHSYMLNSTQRSFLCEQFQLAPQDFELGVVCVSPFGKYELSRSYKVVMVLDENTGIMEPKLELGELQDGDAVFALPLSRYKTLKVSRVRISVKDMGKLMEIEASKQKVNAEAGRSRRESISGSGNAAPKKTKEKIDLSFLFE